MSEKLRAQLEEAFPHLLDQLKELVSIPSVSSPAFDQDKLKESAEFVRSRLENLGLETKICTADRPDGQPGAPAVLARSPHVEGAPTVLLYAHHDVQPAGDPDKWTSNPFEAVVRDGRIYGRGTSDDGAGVIVHLGALTILEQFENLALNVIVYVEGEEEIGSPSFTNFLTKYHDELEADYIIVADSSNWKAGEPALTSSLRGVVGANVTVRVLEHALHSGAWSGPILDSITAASHLIASFHDEDGSVAVEGLAGTLKADVDYDEDEFRDQSGLIEGVELQGRGDLASRLWTQPSISIIGFDATSVEKASNTLWPQTRFKVSLRTAPGTDGREAMDALRRHVEANRPFGAEVSFEEDEIGPAYQANLDSQAAQVAHQAFSEAWNVKSVNIGQGGSIPFISEFQSQFPNAQVIVTGVEDPLTNAHSEDESQDVHDLKCAILAEALMLEQFAGLSDNS